MLGGGDTAVAGMPAIAVALGGAAWSLAPVGEGVMAVDRLLNGED